MALRPEFHIDLPDEIVVVDCYYDTIGGITSDRRVLDPKLMGEEYIEELRAEGYTTARYQKVAD